MRLSLGLQSFATNLAITGLGLANSIALSRWLQAEGRGEVAAVMLWPLMVTYLASFGLIPATVYFTARPGSSTAAVFGNALALAAVQSALVVPLAYLALPYLLASQRPEVVWACRLYLLVVPISLVTQYNCGILQGKVRIAPVNGLRLIIPAGYLAGTLLLYARGGLGLVPIVLLHLGLNLVALALTFVALWTTRVVRAPALDAGLGREMVRYGLKVHVGSISQGVNMRLDQMLIAAWAPPAQLGYYVTAVSAAGLAQTLSQAYRMVITPLIARQESEAGRLAQLESGFRGYWLLSVLLALPIGVGLYWAIPLVYGPAFRAAVWPAEVLVLGAVLLGAKDVLAGGGQALGDPLLESKAELASLVVTLAALAALMPALGILGAAVASVLSYGTSLAIVVVGLHRSVAVSPRGLFRIDRVAIGDYVRLLRDRAA